MTLGAARSGRFGVRVIDRLGPLRLARLAAITFPIAIGFVTLVQYPYFLDPTTIGGDASNYYAAGLRLNAGHDLYDLVPGDRQVPLVPPYWSVPLLSPPPIAVLWRPLALLGDASMWLWWIAGFGLSAGALAWLIRTGSIGCQLGLIALSPALALTAVAGNVNAHLLPLLVGAGAVLLRQAPARAEALAGAAIAIAMAVKVTPIFLVWWLIVGRRWAALGGFLIAAGAIGLASLAGAGLESHLRYLDIAIRTAAHGNTPVSLAGIATGGGLAPQVAWLVPVVVGIVGSAAIWALRSKPRATFALAAALAVATSPVVYFQTLSLLAVALVPFIARKSLAPTPRAPTTPQ